MPTLRQPHHVYDVVIAAPNAAVDSYYVLPHLNLGDVNRSSKVWHTAGGKGNNMTRALGLLGGRALSLGIVGGRAGKFVRGELAREHLDCKLVWTDSATRHTVTVAVPGERQTTVVLEAGRSVGQTACDEFARKVSACAPEAPFLTLTGSLPPGFPADYYAKLIARLRSRLLKICVDSSGKTLRLAAEAGAHLLKVNVSEFYSAFGGEGAWHWDDARAIFDRLTSCGLELLAVTDGPRGAYIMVKDGEPFRVTTPLVTWASTAGAGDTFFAALLLGLGRGDNPESAARFASAAAAASLQQVGCGVLTQEDLQRFLGCTELQHPLRGVIADGKQTH